MALQDRHHIEIPARVEQAPARRILVLSIDVRDFERDAPGGWDDLAIEAGASPFLTTPWLAACWDALGDAEPLCLVARGDHGELRGAAFCALRRGRLQSLTNAHSGEWGVLAAQDAIRERLWAGLAATGARGVRFDFLRGDRADAADAAGALATAGYHVTVEQPFASPHLELPSSYDELISGVSGKFRREINAKRRKLEKLGRLEFRVVRSGDVDGPLSEFLALEASGWKGRKGTAIARDERLARMYRRFARAAARRGWLRLHRLELDGRLVAGSMDVVIAGRGTAMKTAFAEELARFSPGVVLQAEILRSAIADGVRELDFLGTADPYKLRWGAVPRGRMSVHAWRGRGALPRYVWRASVRPALKRVRDAAREDRRR